MTEAESLAAEAYARLGSYTTAAAELGISTEALRSRIRSARRREQTPGVPDGHRLRATSILTDADGELKAKWDKTELRPDEPPAFETVPEGHHVKRVSTMLGRQGETLVQWVQTDQHAARRESDMLAAFDRHVENYRGLAPVVAAPERTSEQLISIYNLGDPHVGMLAWGPEVGEDFDLRIAERELFSTVSALVDAAPAADRAVLANLGDFFHADDDSQLTPGHGHKLDVDSRQGKVFDVGCTLMRAMIDRLLQKHRHVDVRNVPGNHDPMTSRFLAKWLQAVYEKEPRVHIAPNLNPYSYLRFGANLFGWAHGDGAKVSDLPGVMACDQRQSWGETEFHTWYGGHIHHKTRHEFAGCSVETFNTMAARDAWHHGKGYRAERYLTVITHHVDFGEVSRAQVGIKQIRGRR